MNKHTLGLAVIGTLASSLILGQVAQAEEASSTETHDTIVSPTLETGEATPDSTTPEEVIPETNESELTSETVSNSLSESTDVSETITETSSSDSLIYDEPVSEDYEEKLHKIQGYKEFEEAYSRGKTLFRQRKWTFESSAVLHQVLKDTHRDSNPLTPEQFQAATQSINEAIAQLVPLKERQELRDRYYDALHIIDHTPVTSLFQFDYPISDKFKSTRIDAPIVSAPTPEEWQTSRDSVAKLTQLINREGHTEFISLYEKLREIPSGTHYTKIKWTADSLEQLHQTLSSLVDKGEDDFYIKANKQIQQAIDSLVEIPEGIKLIEIIDTADARVKSGGWTQESQRKVTNLITPTLEELRTKSNEELKQLRSDIEVAMNNLVPHPFLQNIKSFTPNINNIIEGEHKEIEITLQLNDGITWDSIKDKISYISVDADVQYTDRKLTIPEQEFTRHFLFRYYGSAYEMLDANQPVIKIPLTGLVGAKSIRFDLEITLKAEPGSETRDTVTIRTPQINVSTSTPFDGIHNYITNTEIDKTVVTTGDSLIHETAIAFPTYSLIGSYNIYRVGENTPFKKVRFSPYDNNYLSPSDIWYDRSKGGPDVSYSLFTTIDIDDSFPEGEYEIRELTVQPVLNDYESFLAYTVPESLYQRFTVKKKADTNDTTKAPRQFADATTNVAVVLSDSAPSSIAKMQVVDVDEAELAKQSELLKSSDADLFAITFVDKDGNKVAVNESAVVTMPVDAGKKVVRLIHFVPETNTATDLDFTQDGNQVTFTAPHFSIYGVIYAQATPPTDKPTDNTPSTPTEPKDTTTTPTEPKENTTPSTDTTKVETATTTQSNNQATLPETGETDTFAIFGTAVVSILSSVGLIASTKRREEQ